MALGAIIFDLDGTLVDTNELHARAWTIVLRKFGHGLGEDRVLREIGKSGSRFVPALLGDRIEEDEGAQLRDAHDDVYHRLVRDFGVRAFPCAERLLRTVHDRGIKTAISTGSARESVEQVAAAAGLDVFDLADVVVTATDVSDGKPGPEPVAAAARQLHLAPAQCALVGDTPFDVASARRAGGVTIGVASGAYTVDELLEAGARTAYRGVAEVGDDLDRALGLCSPGRIRLTEDAVRGLMEEAIAEALTALETDNIPVGAVLADGDGRIVSRAHSLTETSGHFLDHAEMLAFRDVAGKVDLRRRELILVSTLEPCVMCYGAAMDARVDTIVYGLHGPANGGVTHCLPMQSPGMIAPRIISGVRARECRAAFESWQQAHHGTPFVEDLLRRV